MQIIQVIPLLGTNRSNRDSSFALGVFMISFPNWAKKVVSPKILIRLFLKEVNTKIRKENLHHTEHQLRKGENYLSWTPNHNVVPIMSKNDSNRLKYV